MWRSLRHVASKDGGLGHFLSHKFSYTTSSSSTGVKKSIITVLTGTTIGAGATFAYGAYDEDFRKYIENKIPYSDLIFNSLPTWKEKNVSKPSITKDDAKKDVPQESSLLKRKINRERPVQKNEEIVTDKNEIEKLEENLTLQNTTIIPKTATDSNSVTNTMPSTTVDDIAVLENAVKKLLQNLEQSTKEAALARQEAIDAIQFRNSKLYQALEIPSTNELEFKRSLKQVDSAGSKVKVAVDVAGQKSSKAFSLLEKLKNEIKKSKETGIFAKSFVLIEGENDAMRLEKILKESEERIAAVEAQSKTASDYRDLVNKAREEFKEELQTVLPKFVHKNKNEEMTSEELNVLIAHAHRRIEQLQKELAKQKIKEGERVNEDVKNQKNNDKNTIEARIAFECLKQKEELEDQFHEQIIVIENQYEGDMRHQLRRQAAIHADHLQEALKIQHKELQRQYNVDLEDKLLQQKGVFISEMSTSMAKLKEMEAYLKVRSRLNEAARKTQALWVACQAMKNSIKSGFSEKPTPLGKELAIIKSAADEESLFINTILSGIPLQAVERGIYTDEYLKQRFLNVKRICKQVAMIDETNRSIYRYLFSYFQSFFIVDRPVIPKVEQENKIAVDPSEWDTFDILNRITFCLQRNDFVQALRYANQLRGEPFNVARSWIYELQLMLETSQAVDCLITHALTIGLQSYH